jgi:hypothetical protein
MSRLAAGKTGGTFWLELGVTVSGMVVTFAENTRCCPFGFFGPKVTTAWSCSLASLPFRLRSQLFNLVLHTIQLLSEVFALVIALVMLVTTILGSRNIKPPTFVSVLEVFYCSTAQVFELDAASI